MKLTTGYKKPIDSDGSVLLAGGGHKNIQQIINDFGAISIIHAVTFNQAIKADILGNAATANRLKNDRAGSNSTKNSWQECKIEEGVIKYYNVANTWRGIQNNLTSTSTTDSLSANQGKILNEKFSNYLPLNGGNMTGTINRISSSPWTSVINFSQKGGESDFDGEYTYELEEGKWLMLNHAAPYKRRKYAKAGDKTSSIIETTTDYTNAFQVILANHQNGIKLNGFSYYSLICPQGRTSNTYNVIISNDNWKNYIGNNITNRVEYATMASRAADGNMYTFINFKPTWANYGAQIYYDAGTTNKFGSRQGMFFRIFQGIKNGTSFSTAVDSNGNTYNVYRDYILPYVSGLTSAEQKYIAVMGMTNSGNITITGSYYANSDIRYKTILENKHYTSEDFSKLNVFTYNWKNSKEIQIGTSAQDVEQIIPELISEENEIKSLNYAKLGAIGVIELSKEIIKLKQHIKELEERLNG